MTVDALPREATNTPIGIGAHDANIFLCPRCSRPLAVGVSRCAGCGTRLMAGVPLLKVSGFIGTGLIVGLLVGGGGVGAVLTLSQPRTATVAPPPAAVLPSSVPASPAPAPSVVPVAPAVPPAALSALRQSTVINQRLLADAGLLTQAMAASSPAATEIAPLLRSLASTASLGDRAATAVGTWDDAALVASELSAFYRSIDRIAADGLAASLNNARAYRDAGRSMLAVLAGVTDLDAASRGLAASVDVELPPLVPVTE
jgi:hypothetical protein